MITKLSKTFGKEVYTASGARVGRVVDMAIDINTKKVSDIFIKNLDEGFQKKYALKDKKGVVISYDGVMAFHDIILVSNLRQFPEGSEKESPSEGEES